jgi:hypothetical protein
LSSALPQAPIHRRRSPSLFPSSWEIDKQRVQKSQEFAQQELELMKQEREHAQQRMSELDAVYAKQDTLTKLEREQQDLSLKQQKEKLANERAYFEEITPLQDELYKKIEEMNAAQQAYWLLQNEGVQKFADFIKKEFGAGGATFNAWKDFLGLKGGGSDLGRLMDSTMHHLPEGI